MAEHVYDRGGLSDGTLGISLAQFYGDETVSVDLESGDTAAHLTAEQARAVAADLVAHASALEERRIGPGRLLGINIIAEEQLIDPRCTFQILRGDGTPVSDWTDEGEPGGAEGPMATGDAR